MKRSEINNYIKEAIRFFGKHQFHLPPWAFFTPEEWNKAGAEYNEIRDNMLGWDLTDFASGDFHKVGLLLFTIRNGNFHNPKYNKPYAEKIMIVREKQITPTHFHWNKMEDIINRGGGELCIQLWKANEKEEKTDENFTVQTDGVTRHLKAGDIVRLKAGESITLESYIYHMFWAENGMTLVGEVSMVNDDNNDNCFLEPLGRFPAIDEDEKPIHLLCNEYPQ
jgi:D-lyxose ketol-isomerase